MAIASSWRNPFIASWWPHTNDRKKIAVRLDASLASAERLWSKPVYFFVGVNEHAPMSIIVAKILFSKSLLASRFSIIIMLPVMKIVWLI